MEREIFDDQLRDMKALGEEIDDCFMSNYHLSTRYKREKFRQRVNGIKLSTSAREIQLRGRVIAVNDYFFIKNIGHGSFGDVKLATMDLVEDDLSEDHQRFAIKMLKRMSKRNSIFGRTAPNVVKPTIEQSFERDLLESVPEQVRKEIAIMKVLVHPNLVQLLEIINSHDSQYVYLVLEYVDGGPIMKYHPSSMHFTYRLTGTTMGESIARRSYLDLLSGLSFMHSHHIAHRDLKPDNLLVDFHVLILSGNLKISDFGVSIQFDKDVSKSSINMRDIKSSASRGLASQTEGTFPFFSPEMCSPDANTSYSAYMSDMWASAVCLWIFVFGKLPFYDVELENLFQLIRDCDPIWPHVVSPELTDFLKHSLQKDPQKRLYLTEAKAHLWITGSTSEDCIRPSLSLRHVIRLRVLARRVRLKCQCRRETFVLSLKKDVNCLVTALLTELTDKKLVPHESSLELVENKEDGDSVNSDPLAALATDIPEDVKNSSNIRRPSTTSLDNEIPVSMQLDITRFSKLNVLSSIRDDAMKRNSKILPIEVPLEIIAKQSPYQRFACVLL